MQKMYILTNNCNTVTKKVVFLSTLLIRIGKLDDDVLSA